MLSALWLDRMIKKALILVAALAFCPITLADRQLDNSEILEIFTALTASPQKTWIQTGTINATHAEYRAAKITDPNEINARIEEAVQAYQDNPDKKKLTDKLQRLKGKAIPFNVRYKLSNEYTMDSTVVVRVDGDKFYWQIDIGSRTDSVKPPASLADNFMTEEFNLNCNEKRVFAWNGQSYINYFRPLNHATIEPTRFPVNGPLTAGVIPWGYGSYTLQELTKAQSSATEIGSEIHLTVDRGDRQETFVLDPEKAYALKQYSAIKQDGKIKLHTYGNYESINGKWYPGTVLIEQYDTTVQPQKLLARHVWDFTSISDIKPSADDFKVEYEYDAFIEDFCLGGDKPLQYRYSAPEPPEMSKVNTNELIAKRLLITSATGRQNCATASLKYVCDKLGVNQSLDNFSTIVHGDDKSTTLAEMQRFASNAGLTTTAVKTDIETLASAGNYQAIVHLPQQKHFAVLGYIDAEFIRLIDLSSNNFYFRKSIDWFNSAWDGTALLISNKPVTLGNKFAKLKNSSLKKIIGCCGQSCTNLLQSYHIYGCTQIGCICSGGYEIYYTRYGCATAPSGSCSESSMLRYKESLCMEDDFYCECEIDGEWTSYYMQACN